MPGGTVCDDLRPHFSSEDSKMAAAAHTTKAWMDTLNRGKCWPQQPLFLPPCWQVVIPTTTTHSPASTVSLIIECIIENCRLCPKRLTPECLYPTSYIGGLVPDTAINANDLFSRLSELLDRGLAQTAEKKPQKTFNLTSKTWIPEWKHWK